MKFDLNHMRYLTNEDFRVLTAIEMGSRNHELVPTKMISQIAGLRSGSRCEYSISQLCKARLVRKIRNAKYDGYKLSHLGYDYLALKSFLKRDTIFSVGNQIGIGKESDIFVVANEQGDNFVLKVHRLGRTSFKTVKTNRDYLKNRHSTSWMYMSRLAAQKEFEFMKALYDAGFQVPVPIDQSRHMVVMSLVKGFPMRQLTEHGEAGRLYLTLMNFIIKLANQGLIHCDFNEFNIMIRDDYDPEKDDPEKEVTIIDFPQCVSINHSEAKRFFERDVNSIRSFFDKKLGYIPLDGWYPVWERDVKREGTLDALVEASGITKKDIKEFEKVLAESREAFGIEKEGGELKDSDDEFDEDEMFEIEEDYTERGESAKSEKRNDDDDDDSEEEESSEDEEEEEDEEDDYEKRLAKAIAEVGLENIKQDKLGNYIV